jgi:glycerophosphoryl diester phosphodiesterase
MRPPWTHPRVVGHRGGGTLAPENTLVGIRKAVALGLAAVEFDVMLSADNVPVLIHDETLERTTDGRGPVAATLYARLAELDAGAWFGREFRGEPLPSLEQAGKLCVELGLWANIEIKPAPGFERETGAIAAKLTQMLWRGAASAPLLSSFYPAALEAARESAPGLARGFLTERVEPGWVETASALGCVSLHCNHEYLEQAQVDEVRAAGYWLLCYTVNDPESARRLFSWGVDAIFTDRPDLIGPKFA